MKIFIAFSLVMSSVAVLGDQLTHQSFKQGNAPAVQTTLHKAHHGAQALVASQPSAQPSEVVQYGNEEKYVSSASAPVPYSANINAAPAPSSVGYRHPVRYAAPAQPARYQPALRHHQPSVYQQPRQEPTYLPTVHQPATTHRPQIVTKPHPTRYAAPAQYSGAEEGTPATYSYGYSVADDYSGANFAANEDRDGYETVGYYRVALPDGRVQTVNYNVADAYSGYVADVQYEGEATYPEYVPRKHPAHVAPYVSSA